MLLLHKPVYKHCSISLQPPLKKLTTSEQNVGPHKVKIKVFQTPPTVNLCVHQYRSAAEMTSTFETTHTLRYELQSREIYIEERTPITSPGILSEPPQTQDNSVNTVQETPNSGFRLFLSPCMPRTNSLEYINHRHSPSPPTV